MITNIVHMLLLLLFFVLFLLIIITDFDILVAI